MNPTRSTHRLSVTPAGLAAAALALAACLGTVTAANYQPHHHATQAIVQQTQNGMTLADLKDLAKVKRDLFQRLAERSPRWQASPGVLGMNAHSPASTARSS